MPATRFAVLFVSLLLVAGPASADLGYVGCSTPDTAHSFDIDTEVVGPLIDLLPEGNYPYDATIKPDGLEAWIAGASGDGVVVISRLTDTVIARIPTGEYPVSIAFNGNGTVALVSCRDSDRVDLVSTNTYTVFGSLPIPSDYLGPGNIVFDPASENFYLVEWYSDTLYEIAPDGGSILRQVDLGDNLWQLAVDSAADHFLYVTDRGTDQVRFIDPITLTEQFAVAVGDDPWGIDVTASGQRVVVVCEDSHDLYVINMPSQDTLVVPLAPDADPRDVDISDSRGLAYVPSGDISGADKIFVVAMDTGLVSGFSVPSTNPNVIAVQPQAGTDLTAVAEIPLAAESLHLYPNPFNPTTTIEFELPRAGRVDLAVFGLDGRRLRTLLDGDTLAAGRQRLDWDGRDDGGRRLASGVYLLELETEFGVERRRATLLK